MSHDLTKAMYGVRLLAETQISTRVFTLRSVVGTYKDTGFLYVDREDCDQTELMRLLI